MQRLGPDSEVRVTSFSTWPSPRFTPSQVRAQPTPPPPPPGLTPVGMLVCPDRVQKEIDETIGQARRPEMADQARMPFTMAVVHEVQRFGDIIPLGVPHMTSRDIELRGFLIPKVGLWLPHPRSATPTTCALTWPLTGTLAPLTAQH